MEVIPYLSFEGNGEEAIEYYKKVFDAEIIYMMRYSEAEQMPVSEDYKNKLLHAQLKIGNNLIYISDAMENEKITFGNHIDVNINFDDPETLEKVYAYFEKEAKVIHMELQDTFWQAKFASLVDKFGIGWSLNYSYPEK